MKKRRHNPNRAKTNRSYTVEEIAELYGVFKGTVRNWIKSGLPVLDDKRPLLIHGSALAAFHRAKNAKRKQTCKPGEMFCFKCQAPRMPDGGMVDCQPVTEKIWNLVAICPDCYTIMNQRVGLTKMDITLPLHPQHIVESNPPSGNGDLDRSMTT